MPSTHSSHQDESAMAQDPGHLPRAMFLEPKSTAAPKRSTGRMEKGRQVHAKSSMLNFSWL